MKKVKLHLVLVALLAIGAAWINRPRVPATNHNYSFRFKSSDGTKIYWGSDLTLLNYTKGIDYICVSPATTCTFYANPSNSHTDLTGNYFYVSDVPAGGYDNTGSYSAF